MKSASATTAPTRNEATRRHDAQGQRQRNDVEKAEHYTVGADDDEESDAQGRPSARGREVIRPSVAGSTSPFFFRRLPSSVLAGANGRKRATVALGKAGARRHAYEAQPRCHHQPQVQKLETSRGEVASSMLNRPWTMRVVSDTRPRWCP